MEGLIQMLLGFALIALVIGIVLYIVEAIFLNKYNKLVTGKGTILAWIPFYFQAYLLGKLAFNKVVGWVLVAVEFATAKVKIGNILVSRRCVKAVLRLSSGYNFAAINSKLFIKSIKSIFPGTFC